MRPFMMLSRLPGLLALCVILAGCASSEPDYYTLAVWPGAAQPGGPLTLKVRTPGVAGYLDRDYIVRSAPGTKLKLDRDAAWGEPLADMIGQTLTQDLQQRLPGTNVFTQTGAISTEAQATVELDISRFAQDGQGHAELAGSLAVVRANSGPSPSHPLSLLESPDASTTASLATALSKLLGQVADEAAREARAIGPLPPQPAPDAATPSPPVPLTAPPPVPFGSTAS